MENVVVIVIVVVLLVVGFMVYSKVKRSKNKDSDGSTQNSSPLGGMGSRKNKNPEDLR